MFGCSWECQSPNNSLSHRPLYLLVTSLPPYVMVFYLYIYFGACVYLVHQITTSHQEVGTTTRQNRHSVHRNCAHFQDPTECL